jgi:hypothetical protein
MRKFSGILLLIIIFTTAISGRNIDGKVMCNNKNIKDVVVSDGFSFTKTDLEGKYVLNVSEKADFVYIMTPSGYTAKRKEGVSSFFQRIDSKTRSVNFELIPMPEKNGYVLLAIGDPQTKTLQQYKMFEEKILSDMSKTIDSYAGRAIPVISLYLGDVVWDSMDMLDYHKKGMEKLNIPVYTLIGNHDYQMELKGDKECSKAYTDTFGPTYYGFNLGNNYFIVLDNIIYDTDKKYVEDLDQQQISWIKNYIKYIPAGSSIYVAMHATVGKFWNKDFRIAPGHKQLLDILSGYKLSFLTGHTHINSNFEVEPGIIEHNVAASCGAWWRADYAPDGTPAGYQVFEIGTSNSVWYYKTINKDRNYQMELYPKGTFTEHPNAIVAKVWNWDPEWKTEYFEDGKYAGEMQQFTSVDPAYIKIMEQNINAGKVSKTEFERANFLKPRPSFFYFSAVPGKNTKKIDVVVTDRFGNKYKDSITL